MSLVPSKRVDRIYPVVPPLCLLLAAQIAGGFRIRQTDERVLRWSAAALLFSIVFTGGYTAAKCCPIIMTTPIISRFSAAQ
jgi:hypothetical protein